MMKYTKYNNEEIWWNIQDSKTNVTNLKIIRNDCNHSILFLHNLK